MNRRSRTGEIINLVYFDEERKGYIVPQKIELWIIQQVNNIAAGAGAEIIDAENFVALLDQSSTKMRSEETRAACD
jgi:hypothetical protein